MSQDTFFGTLFNFGEKTCFSHSLYNTNLTLIYSKKRHEEQFFSINPLTIKRADANVTVFRNILIEFDSLNENEQLKALKNIPYTTLVWSGGKSYHAIISLAEPCKDREEYNKLVKRIQKKLPDMDKTTSNPSRFSRVPDVVRENGNIQEFEELGLRILRGELDAWLGPAEPEPVYEPQEPIEGYIPPWTRSYLRLGSEPGQRNRDAFKAACDLARAGIPFEDARKMVNEVADLPYHEVNLCVSSAYKTVRGSR